MRIILARSGTKMKTVRVTNPIVVRVTKLKKIEIWIVRKFIQVIEKLWKLSFSNVFSLYTKM